MKQKQQYFFETCFDLSNLLITFDEVGEEANAIIDDTGSILITLGWNCSWSSVIEQVLHELQEVYMLKNGFRFIDTKLPRDYESIMCQFHLTHDQFQLMTNETAKVVAKLLPQLKTEWERLNKK